MHDIHIISGWMREDGRTTGARADWLAEDPGLRVERLEVRSLSDGWAPDTPTEFGSGAGPIFALERAIFLLAHDVADVVVIHGEEPLRTGYSRAERRRHMEIYDDCSIPEGYDRVARSYCEQNGIRRADFLSAARALEANYRATARQRGLELDPPGEHDSFVTDLFRRVDCAHPVIDFEAELVLTRSDLLTPLSLAGPRVTACATAAISDGPQHASEIARYSHLADVLSDIGDQIGELPDPREGEVAMELYTCFPVVPLAFLQNAGWAAFDQVSAFLQRVPITLSGGMNFARAPWNQPALRGLILVAERIGARGGFGLVHGNGGLGGKQGVCSIEP